MSNVQKIREEGELIRKIDELMAFADQYVQMDKGRVRKVEDASLAKEVGVLNRHLSGVKNELSSIATAIAVLAFTVICSAIIIAVFV